MNGIFYWVSIPVIILLLIRIVNYVVNGPAESDYSKDKKIMLTYCVAIFLIVAVGFQCGQDNQEDLSKEIKSMKQEIKNNSNEIKRVETFFDQQAAFKYELMPSCFKGIKKPKELRSGCKLTIANYGDAFAIIEVKK